MNTKRMMKQVGAIQRHIAALTVALTSIKSDIENELASKQAIGNAASTAKVVKGNKTAAPAVAAKKPAKPARTDGLRQPQKAKSVKTTKTSKPAVDAKKSPFQKARSGADKGNAASGNKRV